MTPSVVGVPWETKAGESRVALTPDGAHELVARGVDVIVERGAGAASGMSDDEYESAGAEIGTTAEQVWGRADIVCKVKEPQPHEYAYLRPDLTLLTFLHLAAYPEVAAALLEHKTTAIAYETVQLGDGTLPLLAPMSEIAGRMAVQLGARLLEGHQGGRGVLLGGVPGVEPARVVVLGAGNVGRNAARIAVGMEASVVVVDRDARALRRTDELHQGRLTTLMSNRAALDRCVSDADLVVGAVLVPGGRAPQLVPEAVVRSMRPGSVIVDCAIDQGGCVATSRETTHEDPAFELFGVIHSAVGNLPGAVPRTATCALANVTLEYVARLAIDGCCAAAADPAFTAGFNTVAGHVTHPAVGEALGRDTVDLGSILPGSG